MKGPIPIVKRDGKRYFDTQAGTEEALVAARCHNRTAQTPDEIEDPHQLGIRFLLNGETMQDSSTAQLIFPIPFLIEFITATMTLEPGDILSAGTPPGVGAFRDPPRFLRSGDRMEVEIDRIGTLANPVA